MARRDSRFTRSVLLVHRYMAVAVGGLMSLWCLSGFVMMYQAYPDITDQERLQGLEPLNLASCCDAFVPSAAADSPLPSFRIDMLGGDPVLRTGPQQRRGIGSDPGSVINLRTGHRIEPLSADGIVELATGFARGHGIDASGLSFEPLDIDQWTVQTARRNQPAYRVRFGDAAGSEIYVAGASGEIFQDTNRRERILTWLGAIPHWLYPLQLRQNGPLWTEVVVWTSIIGTFLTATGLYVGITRLMRARSRGRVSPFRGWWYWHHISGLVFGILALTWVFSGLLTMNPWGTLSGSAPAYGRAVTGSGTWQELMTFLDSAPIRLRRGEFSQLESAPFDGKLYVIATRPDGTRVRLDAQARPRELGASDIESVIARIESPVASAGLMTHEDSYYYGHKRTAELPVYRVILDDGDSTRLYINHLTGSVSTVTSTRRLSRWIRTGLHDLDFAGIRKRPIWDVTVIALLAGVTLICVTGTWMALKRVSADFRRECRRLRRRRRIPATSRA